MFIKWSSLLSQVLRLKAKHPKAKRLKNELFSSDFGRLALGQTFGTGPKVICPKTGLV